MFRTCRVASMMANIFHLYDPSTAWLIHVPDKFPINKLFEPDSIYFGQ